MTRGLIGRSLPAPAGAAPRANLVPSGRRSVDRALADLTHAELVRLYAHAKDVLGEERPAEAGDRRMRRMTPPASSVILRPAGSPREGPIRGRRDDA